MDHSRAERLRRYCGMSPSSDQTGDGYTDTSALRERILLALVRGFGDEDSADKLQGMNDEHAKLMREWRLSMDEKRAEIHDHRSFIIRAASQVFNERMSSTTSSENHSHETFSEKDFVGHKFWNVVDKCLHEIGRRKLLDTKPKTPNRSPSTPFRSTYPQRLGGDGDTLDDRIVRYIASRPKLSFPAFKNLSDIEQKLVEEVLSDQRGLARAPEVFGQRVSTVYDRRYVASLRAQLHAAETLARERLDHIRKLESTIKRLLGNKSASDRDGSFSLTDGSAASATTNRSPVAETERRRIAEELRDVSRELALLPERLSEHLRTERTYSAARGRPPKPKFLEDPILLARGLSYDLTTLDLVDAGLCSINEQNDSKNEDSTRIIPDY